MFAICQRGVSPAPTCALPFKFIVVKVVKGFFFNYFYANHPIATKISKNLAVNNYCAYPKRTDQH